MNFEKVDENVAHPNRVETLSTIPIEWPANGARLTTVTDWEPKRAVLTVKSLLEQITPIAIPLKWHAIRRTNGDAQVTSQQILDTMEVIKDAYAPNFEFVFDVKTDLNIVDNFMWYNINWDTPKERVMKTDLRHGDCKTLNIYSGAVQGGLLGWPTPPPRLQGRNVAGWRRD